MPDIRIKNKWQMATMFTCSRPSPERAIRPPNRAPVSPADHPLQRERTANGHNVHLLRPPPATEWRHRTCRHDRLPKTVFSSTSPATASTRKHSIDASRRRPATTPSPVPYRAKAPNVLSDAASPRRKLFGTRPTSGTRRRLRLQYPHPAMRPPHRAPSSPSRKRPNLPVLPVRRYDRGPGFSI